MLLPHPRAQNFAPESRVELDKTPSVARVQGDVLSADRGALGMDTSLLAGEKAGMERPPVSTSTFETENRSRNLLARVRSILSRMAEAEPSASDFAAHLEGRLSALWRAEDAAGRSGSDLELIILDELQIFGIGRNAVAMKGPAVRLSAKSAGVMILALHELATNALKFGAFGREKGQLSVGWTCFDEKTGSWLRLRWVETGVAVAGRAPRHEGFGYDLITRRIAYELGGSGEMVLNPGGAACVITIPLQA